MTTLILTPLRHLRGRTRLRMLSALASLLFGVGLAAPSAALADSASWSVTPMSASWSTTPSYGSTDPGATQTGGSSATPGVAAASD